VLETECNISILLIILELYSEIALSRKPFPIGHLYIYSVFLRITDNMTSQNIDLSSWDILYNISASYLPTHNAIITLNIEEIYLSNEKR
jgi:hypothetical protein